MGQSLQVRKIEWVFPGLARIEPVEKSAVRHAVEFYLVAGPMRLQCRDVDPALREISHARFETLRRINPLHIRGHRGVDIASFQPDAAIEIERSASRRVFLRADQLRLRKRNARFDHQRRQPIAMSIERGLRAVDNFDALRVPSRPDFPAMIFPGTSKRRSPRPRGGSRLRRE